jgi:SAM-dependent methyltransferase
VTQQRGKTDQGRPAEPGERGLQGGRVVPTPTVAGYWDGAAATFDDEPDHGLADIAVREAWRSRLVTWLPPAPADVLDLGCGTGSLSLLLTELGHRVTGLDLAPRMVEAAREKCRGRSATFAVGDAAEPDLAVAQLAEAGDGGAVDAVVVRHVLWTLPDPHRALRRWVRLVRPGGRLVLVEGRWGAAGDGPDARPYAQDADRMPWRGGARAEDLVAALDPLVDHLEVVCLSSEAALWGRPVQDERYAVVASLSPA